MAEELDIQAPPQTDQDGGKGQLPPFLRNKSTTPPTKDDGQLPPFLRNKPQSQTPPSNIPPTPAPPVKPADGVYDPMAWLQYNASVAENRLPATIQANTPKAVQNMSHEDFLNQLSQLQALGRPGEGMENPQLFQEQKQKMLQNTVNVFTGNKAQLQKQVDSGDPIIHSRLVKQIKRDNPDVAPQIEHDQYALSAKDRTQNADQIVNNLSEISKGNLNYDAENGQLQKPLGFWGSLGLGWTREGEERNGYNELSNGTSQENIPKLEKLIATKNPDKPVEVPNFGLGSVGEMIGAGGLPMAASAVVDIGASATGNPEAAPFINAAIWGNEAHTSAWYNSYTDTYKTLRNKGIDQLTAEKEARNQAEFDSNMAFATAALTTMAAGEASKLAKPSSVLNSGSNQLVYDEAGNFLRKDIPIDPAYQKVLNKIYANTIADKTTNLGARILREGGPIAAINGTSQVVQNIYDNKPWDQGVISSTLGNLGLYGSLALLHTLGSTIPGIPKGNIDPSMNPDTEDGAKLFIEKPNGPVPEKTSQDELLNKAKKIIAAQPQDETQSLAMKTLTDAASDPDNTKLTAALKEVAEQGHDPKTQIATEGVYGKDLTDIAKQLHPQEGPDITKPIEDQITPDMSKEDISSLQNAYTEKQRNSLGMPAVDEPARKEFGQSWQDGLNGIANGSIRPDQLVQDALGPNRKPWSDAENAAVLKHQVDKETQLNQVYKEINSIGPDGDQSSLNSLKAQKASLLDQLQDIYTAGKNAGTENARGLNIRKMLADANYSIGAMMQRKQAAQNGAPLTDAQKADVEQDYKDINDAKERRDNMAAPGMQADNTAPPVDAIKADADVQRAKQKFDDKVNQPPPSTAQKYANAFVNWQREFKLSNPVTLAKLGMAGITRLATNPAESAVGAVLGAVLPKSLTEKATSEAGFHADAEARGLTDGFMRGIKDAEDIWKKGGKTDLDFIGDKKPMSEDGINFFGQVHKTIKAPIKRVAFERSWRNQATNLIARGVDPTDPAVMTNITVNAMKDANRAIFMQDNLVSKWWNSGIQGLERQGDGGKMAASTMKWLLPFIKIPTNIAGETGNYSIGSLIGTGRLLHKAITGTMKDMSEDDANSIMRNFKKGSLGAGMLTLGFMNPDAFGGLYQPGVKKQEGDPNWMEAKVGGVTIPRWLLEAPIFQTAQIGATVRHYMDEHLKRGDADIPNSVLATTLGLTAEEPLVPSEVGKLFGKDQERSQFLGQFAKGTVDPAVLQQWARWQQGSDKPKPKGIMQNIESGLPYLWRNVPENQVANSNIPVSGHQ